MLVLSSFSCESRVLIIEEQFCNEHLFLEEMEFISIQNIQYGSTIFEWDQQEFLTQQWLSRDQIDSWNSRSLLVGRPAGQKVIHKDGVNKQQIIFTKVRQILWGFVQITSPIVWLDVCGSLQ